MPVGSNMRCPMSLVRRLWLALALLVAIGPSASAQTTEAVDAVTAALRAGDFAQAAERSRVALAKAPNDARLWTLNGLALARLGRRVEAIKSFERALTIDPNFLAALEGAGQAHYEAGSRRAVPLLERILRQRPDDPTAHAMLAVLDYREGNCKSAVTHFAKAGAVIEAQLDALQAQATCLVRLRELDRGDRGPATHGHARTRESPPAQAPGGRPADGRQAAGCAGHARANARGRRRRRRDAGARLRVVPEGRRHAAGGGGAPAGDSARAPERRTCISTSRTSRSRISRSRWASTC